MTPTIRRRLPVLVALVVTALVAVACGDDGTTATSTTTSTTVDDDTTTSTTADTTAPDTGDEGLDPAEAPGRIVSLSPTATEILFAIGAGDAVVAVDSLSNFPPEAPVTDLEGFNPNVEAIAGFDPDLVVVSFDPGDVVANLEALGIPTLVQAAAVSLDDTYTQIEQLGAVTGHVGDAAELVATMRTELERLAADAPRPAEPVTYYHELDDTFFTVTSGTFVGEIYALFGLENVADPADADGSAFGYPQLSAEYLVDADPDLIFLADTRCCGQSAETVAARPGWDTMTAVREGHVIELDDDVASRWGPRVVDFARAVAEALESVTVTAG